MPRPRPTERGLQTLLAAIENTYGKGPLGVLDAIRRVLHDRDEHLLTVHESPSHDDPTAPGGWRMEHTLDCRITGIPGCPFHEWAEERQAHDPLGHGRYLLTMLAPIGSGERGTVSIMPLAEPPRMTPRSRRPHEG